MMEYGFVFIIVLFFIFTLSLCFFFLKYVQKKILYNQRIKHIRSYSLQPDIEKNRLKKNDGEKIFTYLSIFSERIFMRIVRGWWGKNLEKRLSQAGYRQSYAVTNYLLGCVFFVFILAALFLVINYYLLVPAYGQSNIAIFIFLPIIIVAYVSEKILNVSVKKYRKNLVKGLPDVLDIMIVCFETGYSNDNTVKRISEDFKTYYPELSLEMDLVASELKLLSDRKIAWMNFSERTQVPEIQSIAAVMQQNERFGSPLSYALRTQAQLLRKNRVSQAEKNAAKLPVILTVPLMVFFLPIMFIIILAPAAIRYMHLI